MRIEISGVEGDESFEATIDAAAGINRYYWPMRLRSAGAAAGGGRGGRGFGGRGGGGGTEAAPGTYIVRLTVGEETYTTTLRIRADPEASRIE